jgi:hypothetical protein
VGSAEHPAWGWSDLFWEAGDDDGAGQARSMVGKSGADAVEAFGYPVSVACLADVSEPSGTLFDEVVDERSGAAEVVDVDPGMG